MGLCTRSAPGLQTHSMYRAECGLHDEVSFLQNAHLPEHSSLQPCPLRSERQPMLAPRQLSPEFLLCPPLLPEAQDSPPCRAPQLPPLQAQALMSLLLHPQPEQYVAMSTIVPGFQSAMLRTGI